jgi:MFS family permease
MARNRWWVVVASFFALIVGQGPIEVFATGIFIKPLGQDLHLGRGVISTAMGLANITTAIMVPFMGRWMDRRGVRPVLLPSLVCFAIVTGSLSLMNGSVVLLLATFALQGIAGSGATPTAYSKMIASRFDRRLGLALGLALAGVGAGTALLPQYARLLLQHFGWRTGYVGIGAGILVLSFLPVALCFGETARGRLAQPQPVSDGSRNLPGMEFSEAVRTWRYWSITLAFFLGLSATNGSLIHVIPMLTDRGIPIAEAVTVMSFSGIALIIGRVIAGYFLDKIFAPYIVIFFLLCPMVGIALLALRVGGAGPLVGAGLLGVGVGAEIDLVAFIISRYFGQKAFGALHGLLFTLAVLANAVGNNLLGWCYQLRHSYVPALVILDVFIAIAIVILARLGPYRFSAIVPGEPAPQEPAKTSAAE